MDPISYMIQIQRSQDIQADDLGPLLEALSHAVQDILSDRAFRACVGVRVRWRTVDLSRNEWSEHWWVNSTPSPAFDPNLPSSSAHTTSSLRVLGSKYSSGRVKKPQKIPRKCQNNLREDLYSLKKQSMPAMNDHASIELPFSQPHLISRRSSVALHPTNTLSEDAQPSCPLNLPIHQSDRESDLASCSPVQASQDSGFVEEESGFSKHYTDMAQEDSAPSLYYPEQPGRSWHWEPGKSDFVLFDQPTDYAQSQLPPQSPFQASEPFGF